MGNTIAPVDRATGIPVDLNNLSWGRGKSVEMVDMRDRISKD